MWPLILVNYQPPTTETSSPTFFAIISQFRTHTDNYDIVVTKYGCKILSQRTSCLAISQPKSSVEGGGLVTSNVFEYLALGFPKCCTILKCIAGSSSNLLAHRSSICFCTRVQPNAEMPERHTDNCLHQHNQHFYREYRGRK